LSGEDLGAVLRRRMELPLDEVLDLVDKIADALEAAHAAGVVHRDLKPQNVFLLDDTGEIRLLDFGIAHLQQGEGFTVTRELLGTPGYMAPEQARGILAEIGPHTDVFALGAIAYRAITGKCPFPSRATAAAIDEAIHLVPPAPSALVSSLPTDVDYVLTLALAKRVSDRYAHPSMFAHDLRLAARGELDETTRLSAGVLCAATDAGTTVRAFHPPLMR
jgi:serine/threonine-protein kinase